MGEKVIADFRLRMCARKEQQPVDRISQLPNEILVYILSFLTLQDAARTSVLSKRWTDLWMYVSGLNFDAAKMWEGIEGINCLSEYTRLRVSNRQKYVKWVNKVLQSHKAIVLDSFRIRFDLDKSSKNYIDNWLLYAFVRGVSRLDLNLFTYYNNGFGESTAYDFPHDLLGLCDRNPSAVSPSDPYGNGINFDAFVGFKYLRALTFNNVNVSGSVLEFFLHNCPFLEILIVGSSGYLKEFEVCGPSLALKHLEIVYCRNLHFLNVCDTNIVSLKVSHGERLVLKNVPELVDVYVGTPFGVFGNLVDSAISWLSCCLSNLEVLTLQILTNQVDKEKATEVALPQLTKLKQLTFVLFQPYDDSSLMAFTSLIRASPQLGEVCTEDCSGARTSAT